MSFEYADRWGLITGASSGIGAEFARQLAARGMHLVLVARREERLRELAHELQTQHNTRCEVIPCDLCDVNAPQRLLACLHETGNEIHLLVNNAGIGHVAVLEDTDPDLVARMIRLNIGVLTELTYLVLPQMLGRKAGGVINVASVAAFQPVAYMPVYAASKAFVLHFSEALWAEARTCGVTVMALCPGTTQTEFFDAAGAEGWLEKHRSQTVDHVVTTALRGFDKQRQYYITGWANYLLSLAVRLATRRTAVLGSMKFFQPVDGEHHEISPHT